MNNSKEILIIYPHWPPSNLAGVHRPRLLANFLEEFGWHPVILTVLSKYYEDTPDPEFIRTVRPHVEVHYVKAFPLLKKFRIIGDISLRGFFQMYFGASRLIRKKRPDAILIPIPNYYTAILGRLLSIRFGIPYGIDYIDPWSSDTTASKKWWSRSWLSNKVARILEPFSLKKASFITGVSPAYYKYIFDKNWVRKNIPNVGMPYGFDPADHLIKLENLTFPWSNIPGCKPYIYAGAFLPKSHLYIDRIFKLISDQVNQRTWNNNNHLFFLGTGDYKGKSITDYARENNIDQYVHEIRARFPFLHILNFLSAAEGVLIIGSTEEHYTASKVFQGLLSGRPVFSIMHQKSDAAAMLKNINASDYLVEYYDGMTVQNLDDAIYSKMSFFNCPDYNWKPKLENLEAWSAKESARSLAGLLDKLTKRYSV